MQKATQKEREEFVSLIAHHAGEFVQYIAPNNRPLPYCSVFQFAQRLMRYGATLGRIAENQCNGYDRTGRGDYDEKWAAADERKEERIQKKVTVLCAAFGCTPVFQGDPRGATLKIRTPNCRCGHSGIIHDAATSEHGARCRMCECRHFEPFTNDWGREGICVPTS